MSEWIIKDKNGLEKCRVQKLEYQGEFLGACSVTVSVSSHTPIKFELGDWLEYREERFELNYDPSVVKEARRMTYGEAFQYENIVFNSLSDELTRCDFLDYVKNDNGLHYSSLPTFSFFAESIEALVERIQVNLDRIYTEDKKWTVEIHPEYESKTNVNIAVNNNTVWDALGFVNSKFGANFIIRGRNITVGTTGLAVGQLFSYGKGNGLYKIERNAESNQKVITRLRAYGSTRNMPTDYYRNVSGSNIPNNMAVKNLMLPSFPIETHDPYLNSENIGKLGIREGTVFFDGSGDLEEIYPTMEGMTAEALKKAGVSVNAEGRLDEVVGAEQITDDGKFAPEEGEEQVTVPDFTITLKDIGFDINDYLSTSTATISMKDGMCGGRDFEIVSCEKEGDNYVLTCHRHYDEGLDLYFPYNSYQIKSGDKFVLLNIEMPDVYIKAASQRLLEAATEYLKKNDYVRYSYALSVDNIFLAKQHEEAIRFNLTSIHDTIKEGDLMLFEDSDLEVSKSIIISSLSIKEHSDESIIPEYDIVLKDEKTVGTIEKIQNQITNIIVGGSGGSSNLSANLEQIKSIVQAVGQKLFLSKVKDDRSKGKVSSDRAIEVGNYVSGASGAIIYKDMETGQTVAEFDKLYVRMKAYFETLVISEVETIRGKQIISPAGSIKCIGMEELEESYRCYFLGEQDGTEIENRFKVNDQAFSQTFNVKKGTHNKISNTYFWRLVVGVSNEVVDYKNNKCHYIDLSKTDCDKDSDIPKEGDIINHRGNRTDVDRMNFIEQSSVDAFSPNVTLFHGVNSYSLDGKAYVSYGVDKSTNKAFMNVYGEMYVGDRRNSSYIRYTQEGGLEISGTLSVGTKLGDTPLKDLISASSPEGYQEFVEKVTQDLEGLQAQIDGAIESYFFQYNPTLENYPAMDWIANGTEKAHLNDTFTNLTSGYSWRWSLDGSTYKWVEITDTATTKALAMAGQAQDTADGKRRVFVDTPKPPYDKGDLWARGSEHPLMVCVNPKSNTGIYEESDFGYADNNAKLKEEIQKLVSDTKDELNNAIGQATEAANKYADQGISAAKQAINASINALNEAKANVNDVYSKSEADGKIDQAEADAIAAAKKQADAAIALSEETIKAYADGKVTAEEQARIKQAQENLASAKAYAEEKAQEIKNTIINSYDYLAQALNQAPSTEVSQGLVLTSLIQMRDVNGKVKSGLNGLYGTRGDRSIATWWGGGMYDLEDYFTWNGKEWIPKYSGTTADIPSGLIRMDGTGYLAKGKFWWDNSGRIFADPTALFLMFDIEDEAKSLSSTILAILDRQAEFESMWSVKTDASGKKYLYSTFPLVTQGGISMYTGTEGLNLPGIYDGLPIDGSTIYWENGVLKALSGGGVADSVAWNNITNKPSWITESKPTYSIGSLSNVGTWADSVADVDRIMYQAAGSSSWIAKTISSIGLNSTELQNYLTQNSYLNVIEGDNRYLKLSGGVVKGVTTINGNNNTSAPLEIETPEMNYNGYIKFASSGTTSGYLGMGGIDKPVFRSSTEINYTLWHSGNDGADSGLDADLLDGKEGSWYIRNVLNFQEVNGTNTSGGYDLNVLNYGLVKNYASGSYWANAPVGFGYGMVLNLKTSSSNSLLGQLAWDVNHNSTTDTTRSLHWRTIQDDTSTEYAKWHQIAFTDSNVASATKLQKARTIWGQSFDGTGDVDGLIQSTTTTGGIEVGLRADGKDYSLLFGVGTGNVNRGIFDITNEHWWIYRDSTTNTLIPQGNVGIGTTSPSYKLDVDGSIRSNNVIITKEYGLFLNNGLDGIYIHGSGISWHDSSNSWSASLISLAKDSITLRQNTTVQGSITTNDSVTINGIKLSKSKDGVLYLDGNLVVKGGVTMYGTDATSSPSIFDSLPIASTTTKGVAYFDSEFFSVGSDGKVSFIGKTDGLNTTELQNYLTSNSYLNVTTGDSRYVKVEGGAKRIRSWYGGDVSDVMSERPTSANVYWTDKSIRYFLATSSMTEGKPANDAKIIHLSWDNSGWNSQLAVSNYGGDIQWRSQGKSGPTGWGDWITVLDSNNYSSYALPLSGGTITVNQANGLRIIRTDNKYPAIAFYDNDTMLDDYIGFNPSREPVWFNSGGKVFKFWHEGNDGDGSGLDADTLDGLDSENYFYERGIIVNSADANDYWKNGAFLNATGNGTSNSNFPQPYSIFVNFTSGKFEYISQLSLGIGNAYYRTKIDSWSDWREFAFTNSNVASATKLQTARTIWGQSFDGTGNVDGGIVMKNDSSVAIKNSSGSAISVFHFTSSNALYIGYGAASNGYRTYIDGNDVYIRYGASHTDGIVLNSLGNVGIGTTSPSYKLHVNGSMSANSLNINTTSSDYKLNIKGSGCVYGSSSDAYWWSKGSQYQIGFGIGSGNVNRGIYGITEQKWLIRFDASNTCIDYGNVGIGTTSPSHKLHVVGNTYLNGDVFADELNTFDVLPRASATYDLGNSSYKWNNVYASSMIAGYIHGGGSALYLGNSDNSSYIYIRENMKASSESWSLTTSGTMSLSGDLTSGSYGSNCVAKFQGIGSGNGYSSVVELITNNEVSISYSNSSRYSDSRRWSVGRASSNSNYRFNFWNASYNGAVSYIDLNGNFWVAGGVTMYSDRRKKTILRDVELSLEEVANAPLIEHYYNNDDKKTIHVGSIAQYWAGLNDWFCKLDSEGFYTMEIQNAALASAISVARELDRYESKTDKDIKKLKKRICELEEEVERLKRA